MRKFGFLLSMLLSAGPYLHAQLPSVNPMYDSVLVENFNGSSLDTSKWAPFYPWGGGQANFFNSDTVTGWCGLLQDLANIKRDTGNCKISGGTCKLIAKKETTYGQRWHYFPYPSTECTSYGAGPVPWDASHCLYIDSVQFKYTNALFSSRYRYKYGYFTMRFRLPEWSGSVYNGFSPTFWLYNNHGSLMPWSELDIFEIDATTGMATNNIHIDTQDDGIEGHHDPTIPGTEQFPDLSQWHTASMHWTPSYIDFYLDDIWLRRSTQDTNQNLIDMSIIVENVVSATNYCRNVDYSNTTFPITYELDYIKAYQPKLACDTDKVYHNVTAATFDSKLYKSLVIGGSTYTATFDSSKATAAAVDYVLLDEGFSVGTSMDMLINTEPCWDDMELNHNSMIPQIPYDQMTRYYKQIKHVDE